MKQKLTNHRLFQSTLLIKHVPFAADRFLSSVIKLSIFGFELFVE